MLCEIGCGLVIIPFKHNIFRIYKKVVDAIFFQDQLTVNEPIDDQKSA